MLAHILHEGKKKKSAAGLEMKTYKKPCERGCTAHNIMTDIFFYSFNKFSTADVTVILRNNTKVKTHLSTLLFFFSFRVDHYKLGTHPHNEDDRCRK